MNGTARYTAQGGRIVTSGALPRRRGWPPALRVSATMIAGALALMACGSGAVPMADGDYAQRLVSRVNDYRMRHAQGALAADPALVRLAREHSEAMARAGKLSHDGFAGRAQRSGYAICVENVGWNYATAEDQLDGWRRSAGHERNLVDRRVDRIGVARVGDYVTMLACGR